jgi:hypothetical protein
MKMSTDSRLAPRPAQGEPRGPAAAGTAAGDRLDASGSLAAAIGHSKRAAVQRQGRELIQGSAHGVAQGRLIGSLFGPAAVVQRVLAAGDLAAANIPGEHIARVLAVLQTYDEETIRASLGVICGGLATVGDWANYSEADLRGLVDGLIGEPEEPVVMFTLNDGAMNNPWLHAHLEDFGSPNPRLLVDDAEEVEGYYAVAQTCSVMSVKWLQNSRAAGQYTIRTAGGAEQIARAIYANQSAEQQFAWAAGATGLTRVNAAPSLEDLTGLGVGGRFVLYSGVHVSAGVVQKGGFLYYDPETGTASVVGNDEMAIYLFTAQGYLHS